MNITKLEIQRFRKFSQRSFEFSPGLNIVKGPNEQGKSTLVSAIIAALFFDSKKSNKAIKDNQSWGEDRLYSLLLEFESQDEQFVLQKDFETKHLLLKNVSQKTHVDTYADVIRNIELLTGFATPSLYESTACIRQDQIAQLGSGKKELDAALQDVVTSGADSVSAVDVLKQLQKAVVGLKKGVDRPAVNPGPIKILQDEIDQKQQRAAELSQIVDRFSADSQQSKELREKKIELEKRMRENEDLFKQNTLFFELDEKKKVLETSLEAVISKLERLKELEKIKHEFEVRRKEYAFLFDKNIDELERRFVEFAAQKKALVSQQEDKPQKDSSKRIYFLLAGLAGLIGLGGVFIHPYLYAAFVVALSLVVYAFVGKKEEVVSRSEKDISDIEKIEETLLASVNSVTAEDFFEKKRAFEDLEKEIERVDIALKEMSGSVSVGELEEDKRRVSKDIAVLEARFEDLGSQKKLSAAEFHSLEQNVVKAKRELAVVSENLTRAETRVDLAGNEIDELTALEEEIPYLKEKLEQEQKRLAVFEQAFMGILEAKNAVAATAKDVLTKDINQFLPFITSGKYTEVEIDDDLTFFVRNEHGDMIRPEEYLSRGTIDQFYLAARFSLVKMLSGNARPPIILDDPLVTFDAERTHKAMELIQEFSKEFQIFLMTYSDDYDEWGNVVEI